MSIFDPPLWAVLLEGLVNAAADPLLQGIVIGTLFTTIKRIYREGLTS